MPSKTARLRDRYFLPENPLSLAGRARARRWQLLLDRFPNFTELRVLDLGGTPHSWNVAPHYPGELTLVNLDHYDHGKIRCLQGDACDPPTELEAIEFDLVYSNSVIEHVGGYKRRQDFAQVVDRSAPHHWVQTPARSFPIEPHWLFPGFQFLPVGARARVAQRWPFGFQAARGDRAGAIEEVLYVDLIGPAEMGHLFPRSEIIRERFGGLTKSLIAAR